MEIQDKAVWLSRNVLGHVIGFSNVLTNSFRYVSFYSYRIR